VGTLAVTLDKPDAVYAAGEKITGVVEVRSDSAATCNGLRVKAVWTTRGHGNVTGGETSPVELFRGAWQEGDRLSYEFAITAPAGPVTYAGEHLSIDWAVRATADVPWHTDPSADVPFRLTAGAVAPYFGPSFTPPAPHAEPTGLALGCILLIAMAFFAPGLIAAIVGIGGLATNGEIGGGCGGLFGALFMAAGAWIFYMAIRNRLAMRTLGTVDLSVEPPIVRRGAALAVRLAFTPRRSATVERVTFTFTGKESATRGSGKHKNTQSRRLHEETATRLENGTIDAGRPVALDISFAIPPDAAPTFDAPSNEVKWSVDVHISLPGRPDWSAELKVAVSP
jgi:hypothetical protein